MLNHSLRALSSRLLHIQFLRKAHGWVRPVVPALILGLTLVLFPALSAPGARADAGTSIGPSLQGGLAYSWLLKSGLMTVDSLGTLRVMVVETSGIAEGGEVVISLLDEVGSLVGSWDQQTSAFQPAIAEYLNDSLVAAPFQLKIKMNSTSFEFAPIITVEVLDRKGKVCGRISCAGPLEREPLDFSGYCSHLIATRANP